MKKLGLAVRVGLRGLSLRKGRAVLMMLGVAIGVLTLTLVVSVARGAKAKVEGGIANFGPDAILVAAGSPQTRGPGDERVTTLTPEDAQAIRDQVKGVRVLAPMVVKLEQTMVAGGNNTTAPVIGSTPDYNEAWDWPMLSGEILSEAQEASSARVAMVGLSVVKDLFGSEDPVGQSIRVGDQTFKVVGVLGHKGISPMGMDMDRRLVIPLSTAMRRLYNVNHYSMLRVRAAGLDQVDPVVEQIGALLRERHHIGANETEDFAVRSPTTFRTMAAQMTGMLTKMLGIITLISLIAGAVVLANILLASVGERRVEIGLIRALGATRSEVVRQFVVEGMVVTLLGGAAGVFLGTVAALALAQTKIPAQVGWQPFALALVASLAVGIAASIVPARRAAQVEPANALRP